MILGFRTPKRLSPIAPKTSVNLRAAGDQARDARRWGEAAKLYRAYLLENPKDFDIWVQCGHAEKESGDFDAALSCYLEARTLRGDDSDLHLQLGHLYKLMDRDADAIGSYQKCLEFDPGSVDAKRELGGLLQPVEVPAPSEFSEPPGAEYAAPAFEFPLATILSDDELLARIALEQDKGDALAVALLTRAYVRLAPNDPGRWKALAQALEHIGDDSQARRCHAIAAALSGVRKPLE